MLSVIWCHLYNSKKVKSNPWRSVTLVNFQALAFNFTKSNTPPWVLFTFVKLCKWYQIAQRMKCDKYDRKKVSKSCWFYKSEIKRLGLVSGMLH